MPRIPTYVAPEQELRPSQTGAAALETAGRRINPLYQSIAENERRGGQIQAQEYKELLWPRDIIKLAEDRNAHTERSGGVRFHVAGGGSGFGGDTETFSDDPTQDYATYRGHGQISRGAGALGNALADGGYGLSSGTGSGYRSPSEETDYTGNQDYYGAYSYNPSPAQIALDKYNKKMDAAVQSVTDQAVATRDYWTQYYSGKGSQYQTDQTYNQAIRDSVTNQPPPIPPSSDTSSSGGFWSGLKNFISGSDGTTSSDYNTP